MLEAVLMGCYEVNFDESYRFYFPDSLRNILKKHLGPHYFFLASQQVEDGLKYVMFEPISKAEYCNENKQIEGVERSLTPEEIIKLDRWGRATLPKTFFDFIDSQEGDKYYILGCGRYCELHKTSKEGLSSIINPT